MAMVAMIGLMAMVAMMAMMAMIGVMAMIATVAIKSLSSEGRSLPSPHGRGEYFIWCHFVVLCVDLGLIQTFFRE